MSSYQIDNKRKDIQKLKDQNAKHQKDISDRRTKIIRCNDAIRRTNSQSTVKNRLREIERYEKDIANFDKKIADNLKKDANLNKQLNDLINKRDKERDKQFNDTLRSLEAQKSIAQEKLIKSIDSDAEQEEWDVFLSHASED